MCVAGAVPVFGSVSEGVAGALRGAKQCTRRIAQTPSEWVPHGAGEMCCYIGVAADILSTR